MSKHEDIKASLPAIMKAKEEVRLTTVRGLLTALANEAVSLGKTPRDFLTDAETDAVIKRLAKQRKDSIEQYESAGRSELAEREKAELAILEEYLPQMMSQEEIRPIAAAKKEELGVTDTSKMGVLIGAVMKETAGKVDGGDVKAVVEELLTN